jgi:hypothetical protein
LALIMAVPIPTMAMGRVDVGVSIPLPPPIGFAGPPEMVVIPETYIYVVPDSDEDIFFYSGWWWRPWNGRWYRSQNYSSGWGYYQGIPSFYVSVPSGWRNDYRQRRWGGHEWNYQRIPQQQVQQNWQGWERDRHWEKQNTWGVRDLRPRTRSQQPSQTVQPKPQARPQYREVQQQQSRPQARDIREQQYRPQSQPVKRQVRKADQQHSREIVQPRQSRPQSQKVEPQVRKADKPQQSKSRKGKPEREKEEEQKRR